MAAGATVSCFMVSIVAGGGGGGAVVVVAGGVIALLSVMFVSVFFEQDIMPPVNATNAPSTMSLRSLMAITSMLS